MDKARQLHLRCVTVVQKAEDNGEVFEKRVFFRQKPYKMIDDYTSYQKYRSISRFDA